MRDIQRELAIIKELRTRNKVPKSWIEHIQNLGNEPIICTQVPLRKAQEQMVEQKNKPGET